MRYCISTHGGAGYAYNSHWNDDGTITCGICEAIIEDPHPTGGTEIRRPGWRGLFFREHYIEPNWGWLGTNKVALERYLTKYPETKEWRR